MTANNLSAWIDMAEGLYDFLNRRKTTINYKFTDMTILVPQSTGANPEKAEWNISGTISVSTQENAQE
ncbi:MAG: hypothetical protein CMP22_05685 [Rickettsiales bacterium]|nr:hypothetical protein [Rickettsiales bacterium]|tara:strand:+ start:234 stop:437 length:204 start_codon:yes stop_codon:yes gene_type:complete